MLAEIFMLRLEALAREAAASQPAMVVSDTRFVPISRPPSRPVPPSGYPEQRWPRMAPIGAAKECDIWVPSEAKRTSARWTIAIC